MQRESVIIRTTCVKKVQDVLDDAKIPAIAHLVSENHTAFEMHGFSRMGLMHKLLEAFPGCGIQIFDLPRNWSGKYLKQKRG